MRGSGGHGAFEVRAEHRELPPPALVTKSLPPSSPPKSPRSSPSTPFSALPTPSPTPRALPCNCHFCPSSTSLLVVISISTHSSPHSITTTHRTDVLVNTMPPRHPTIVTAPPSRRQATQRSISTASPTRTTLSRYATTKKCHSITRPPSSLTSSPPPWMLSSPSSRFQYCPFTPLLIPLSSYPAPRSLPRH